jgi:hypothetical protein
MISIVNINPEEDSSFFSKLFSSKPKRFPDYFKYINLISSGFIARKSDTKIEKGEYKLKSKELAISNFEGEWGYEFNIDGKNYWKQGEAPLELMEKMEFTLPSDSTFREDVMLLKHGQEDYAQLAKMNLENLQRADKKLRTHK